MYIAENEGKITRKQILNSEETWINNGKSFDSTNLYVLYGDKNFPKKRRLSLFGTEDAVIEKTEEWILQLTDAGRKYLETNKSNK